jgi:hypothetical protein
MKVFLANSTECVGSAVTDALRAAGQEATDLTHSDEAVQGLEKQGAY